MSLRPIKSLGQINSKEDSASGNEYEYWTNPFNDPYHTLGTLYDYPANSLRDTG